MFSLEVEFLGLPVKYGIFPVVNAYRPTQLFVKVLDKGGNGLDVPKLFSLRVS